MKLASNGLTVQDYKNLDEFFESNRDECLALIEAEKGNRAPLAQLVLDKGVLATHEAREFVAKVLKGLPIPARKRTVKKAGEDVAIIVLLNEIMAEHSCSEYKAKKVFLDRYPDWNAETLKSALNRGKRTIALAKKSGRFMG